jgi:hypothetical protein
MLIKRENSLEILDKCTPWLKLTFQGRKLHHKAVRISDILFIRQMPLFHK